ncbi:PREDICTED: uncharacterized protein LOC109238001 [Nicotiana attenuata]|uniref:uncharacterized protein LOC109238001 n=1 Tax=Nicotiana attenuata TaxID=49451 RepID=UPI0009058248|nr:PREDICTED: uncharacterized protein LOC109238001 [Nicotiana attenuata]
MNKGSFDRDAGPKEAPELSEYNFIDASAIVSPFERIKDTRWPRPLQTDLSQRTKYASIVEPMAIKQKIAGISANIIPSRVVEQLGIQDQVVPVARFLNGFNMACETTKGEITFPVNVAGTIHETKFHVIEGDMSSGKFLGFMESNRGTEINPDKIKAIEHITVVDNVKVVQRLTGHIVALGRFISRSSNKSHRFILLLKKKNNCTWTSECQQALEDLKRYLSSPLLLHTPRADEQLYLYPIVSEIAISGVLVREEQGLELAKGLGAEVIEAKCDSLLVVNQVKGTFEVREERLQRYLDRLQVTQRRFKEWTLQHVPRDQNREADALTNLGSSVEDNELNSWVVVQLMRVFEERKLPSNPKESRALGMKAARFSLSEDGTLLRRMSEGPLAICLVPGDTKYVMREVHKGTCGNHSSAESLVRKVIRAGYNWIDMEKDAKEFVQKCDKCQRHAPMIYQPGELLHSISSPWPFMSWAMDIVGPLPSLAGKAQFVYL